MSTTLHAFRNYKIEKFNYQEEIIYEEDEDYDINSGNWHYIYQILDYGKLLLGIKEDIMIPVHDKYDDVDWVENNGICLIEPSLMIHICKVVLNNIILGDCDNFLFELNEKKYGTYQEQKEKMIHYANMLLEKSSKGLYLVRDRD